MWNTLMNIYPDKSCGQGLSTVTRNLKKQNPLMLNRIFSAEEKLKIFGTFTRL